MGFLVVMVPRGEGVDMGRVVRLQPPVAEVLATARLAG